MGVMDNVLFGAGSFTTVGAAYALVSAGTGNWTGARTGVGVATITWGSGLQIDATESVTLLTAGTADRVPALTAQVDTMLTVTVISNAAAAAESIVHFMVLRTGP